MRNLTNTGGDIFINNMFANGEAIEVIQQSNNTQAKVNVSMKENTTEETSVNDTDLFLVGDTTGKIIKYITGANMKTIDTNFWSRGSGNIFPATSTDTILANNKIEIDTIADATYLDSLIFSNTNSGTDILNYKFMMKDDGSYNAYLKLRVEYSKNGANNDVFEISHDGQMIITKRLLLSNGLQVGEESFNFLTTGGTLATTTFFTASSPLSYNNSTGVFTTTFTPTSTTNMSNKTFTNATTFNQGLYVKYDASTTTSGFVRFYEASDYGDNYIDLHPQSHSIASSINVFLPNSLNNTILVGKDTTDTLTNKTINNTNNTITTFTGNSSAVITTPSTTGTLALQSEIPSTAGFITATSTDTLQNKTLNNTNNTITTFTGNSSAAIQTPSTSGTLALQSEIPTSLWTRTTFIGGSEIKPSNNDYLQIESGKIILQNATEGYDIISNYTDNTFEIKEKDGTLVFKYDSDNGYIDFGTIASARMNFGNYIIHGEGTAYPTGVGMPFGTTNTMYVSLAFIKSITTDEVAVSEFNGNPASTSSYIRCDSSSRIYFSSDKLKVGEINGSTDPTSNYIVENSSYGWEIGGEIQEYCLRLGGTAGAVYLGDDAGSFQLHLNGTGDAYKVGSDLQHLFYGNGLTCANSRFKANYSSDRCFLTNPSGTDNAVSFAGSFLAYHDNGTELNLNCPNSSYGTTNSSNIQLSFNGLARIKFFGSTNPAVQYLQTDGSTTYLNVGRTSTFPTGMGGTWDSQSVPIGNAYYQGGANTNDTEGFWFCQNGQTTAFSSTADLQAIRWYNEDSITTGFYISSGGSISTFSDSRLKTEIIDWKNTDKEKYKKIRTIRYKEKIPDNINPKRLKKQSCIDHYNERHYGVIAQEIFELYPEIKNDNEVREYNKWKDRKDNWNNGIYEKEHKEWEKEKDKYENCDQKDCKDKCSYKVKEPPKIFDEEEPYLHLDYNRINIITIGVVQDLIKENEELKSELQGVKDILNKLINSKSFADFKKTIA
mgnify:CR=1 FL=1|tara:strand:- start:1368 stop:4367 length:3000 start_codon:yes stop_codon:yes gene_type:complete